MSDALVERAGEVLTPNYRPAPVVFERGEGMHLYDERGQRYLDFAAGIAVCALGHGHPDLARTLAEQARKLLHVSNLYLNRPSIELAERLTSLSFADRVYFGNSGTEANEAALKLARRYMQAVRGEDRFEFICFEKSFHGRTWASITATGQPKYHEGFGPLVPGFLHVPYGDLDAVAAKIGPKTCAVFVEPLQGEGGVIVPPAGFLAGLRALCDEHGLLLIYDEVQTGVGRTGEWFCYQHDDDVRPDIMTLAKGLGGGVPIGAMVCTEQVAHGFVPGVHASTFGGNPFACAAGLTVFDVLERDALVDNAREVGAYLANALESLTDLPMVRGVRGRGLLAGLAVDPALDRRALMWAALDAGLLITTAGPDALRFAPPLIVGRAHVDEAVSIVRDVLKKAA